MNLELWKRTKKERGMTYHDISAASGIPLGTIKNIFAGYTPDPRESTIKAIELALGVETFLHSNEKTAELTPDGKEILSLYARLPADLQHRAMQFLKNLVSISEDEKILKRGNK